LDARGSLRGPGLRLALDTNILVYAEGVGDEARRLASLDLIALLIAADVVLPAQALGELYRVLTAKAKRRPESARVAVLGWSDAFLVADSTWTAFQSALDLAGAHGLQIWDALILSVAAEYRCRLLLTEDLQPGFVWRGVTVVNPYAAPPHPLLQYVTRR
jgi:predicted nucleic acid-binding protein